MQKEEFIQDYIANRLSDTEKARFETLLETDAEFREAYETYQEVAMAFQLSKSNEIKQRLQAIDALETTAKTRNFFQLHFRKMAIAAVFIVGMFLTINALRSDGNMYDSYFEICPNTYLPVTRGENEQHVQFEAFKAYESADYATAEKIFNTILKTDKNPTTRFYYAMSLLNQEKFDLALAQLETLRSITFDYQVETLWYAALIELKNENFERAKSNFEAIDNLDKNFKATEIQEILAKL
ncbi:tetratricopeptide repeat protein [Kordia jejudonensis]|uniref:hypothetical protein n=1 Tax=Kordia jejudonensis TaxID=1348245 RepID=UPI0006293024|nr:hypothetical protein [Kordia jejudonensis]